MTADLARLTSTLADRYHIERELGQGGMASVYPAEDVRHRRKVALKVLHPELSAVLGPERFLKEIELTANLQHPHILPLFDSGEASGQLYYVMPYVDGETLRARLERESQLPVPEAIRLAKEVGDALQYAHGRGDGLSGGWRGTGENSRPSRACLERHQRVTAPEAFDGHVA